MIRPRHRADLQFEINAGARAAAHVKGGRRSSVGTDAEEVAAHFIKSLGLILS